MGYKLDLDRGGAYNLTTTNMKFEVTDCRQETAPRLLLASISASSDPKARNNHLKLPGAGLLRHLKQGNTASNKPPSLNQAGEEIQRAAAILGSIVLAGAGHVAQHIATAHARANKIRNGRLPFSESFTLPWNNRKSQFRKSNREHREAEALASNLMVRGREYERQLDVRAAVQCFEEASKLAPTDLAYLCLAAKQWSDLTFYHDVRTDRERQFVNSKAVEYAERAIEAHPTHAAGYLGYCISKGRLALFVDNRNKVKLAKEAQDAAKKALSLAPDDDIAHHLMGRWHYEMARINMVVRAAVRLMYGTALEPGSRDQALEHYRKAIDIAPQRLVHRVEAGRVLMEMGHAEEARKHLQLALECEVEDINAWHTRFDAEMLLAAMDGRKWRRTVMFPPLPGSSTTATTAATSGVVSNGGGSVVVGGGAA